jgi:tetratricopeptide (TPR) repeat protein
MLATLCGSAALILLTSGSSPDVPEPKESGVVVEELTSGGGAQRAGLLSGDRLLRWERGAAQGKLQSPFDLDEVEIEQAPRGEVKLATLRDGRFLDIRLGSEPWGLHSRPEIPPELLPLYEGGRKLVETGAVDAGAGLWRQAAQKASAQGSHATACWLKLRIAQRLADAHRWDAANGAFPAAVEEAEAARDQRAAAQAWESAAREFRNQKDLLRAEEAHHTSLRLRRDLAPESFAVARSLGFLGRVFHDRGDLAAAEECYRGALELCERLAPESLPVAESLTDLGAVAKDRGQLDAARHFHERALAIEQKLAPGSIRCALSLYELGDATLQQGDLDAAERFQLQALAILERRTASKACLSLNALGLVAQKRGDLKAAAQWYRKALDVLQPLPPGLSTSDTLQRLGDVALAQGSIEEAKAQYRKALSIRERLRPGSAAQAESLHTLGDVARLEGRDSDAAELYCESIEALENQLHKLGGPDEARSTFRARHRELYGDLLDLLIRLDRPAEAFAVLERSRARILLEMLAERDLVLTDGIPETLVRERKRTEAAYDRTQAQLAELAPEKDASRIEQLRGRLWSLRDRREQIAQEARRLSPHLAALRDPQPLDLDGVRAALDPGTLLLAYSVGPETSTLFAVRPREAGEPGVQAFSLPIGPAQLDAEVGALRSLVEIHPAGPRARQALRERGARLYRMLLGPAKPLVDSAQRLLVAPDGALWLLPFAALQRPDGTALVQHKPLHLVASGTLYAELRKERPAASAPERPVQLVAFGDPFYPAAYQQLPSTRTEARAIAGLFGSRAVTYLGAEATEERAKSVGKGVRYLHFACHGLLDARFPLDSALALSIPKSPAEGQDNGLLQVWEIFESVRLDADLVTLSACETALGKDFGGEGLIGLTRAFQYAGARSVLASLWKVSDESTSRLMQRFYEGLQAGLSKDEALRNAQLALLADPAFADPFHWAGFVLLGDWR